MTPGLAVPPELAQERKRQENAAQVLGSIRLSIAKDVFAKAAADRWPNMLPKYVAMSKEQRQNARLDLDLEAAFAVAAAEILMIHLGLLRGGGEPQAPAAEETQPPKIVVPA